LGLSAGVARVLLLEAACQIISAEAVLSAEAALSAKKEHCQIRRERTKIDVAMQMAVQCFKYLTHGCTLNIT
jgi:hypothetical protein